MIKIAGSSPILDGQDDPGSYFDEHLAAFWPRGLGRPDLGVPKRADLCLGVFDTAFGERAVYPVDTPENTMASSMYFLRFGMHAMEREDMHKVAQALSEMRAYHEIKVPTAYRHKLASDLTSGLLSDGPLKVAHLQSAPYDAEDAYIDETHRGRAGRSILEQLNAHNKLAAQARLGGYEHAEVHARFGYFAREHVMDRLKFAQHELDDDEFGAYMSLAHTVVGLIDGQGDEYERFKTASQELGEFEESVGLDRFWGSRLVPPHIGLSQRDPDNLAELFDESLDKQADQWSDVDWEKVASRVPRPIVNAMRADPATIVPSMPDDIRSVVEMYRR